VLGIAAIDDRDDGFTKPDTGCGVLATAVKPIPTPVTTTTEPAIKIQRLDLGITPPLTASKARHPASHSADAAHSVGSRILAGDGGQFGWEPSQNVPDRHRAGDSVSAAVA
jgi:hypothetical protein